MIIVSHYLFIIGENNKTRPNLSFGYFTIENYFLQTGQYFQNRLSHASQIWLILKKSK